MPFTWVDWAIVAIVAISALISLSRGFVKEALSLLTWIIAGVVAWMFGGALALHLVEFIETPSARVIAACAMLFIATLLVGALVFGLAAFYAAGYGVKRLKLLLFLLVSSFLLVLISEFVGRTLFYEAMTRVGV